MSSAAGCYYCTLWILPLLRCHSFSRTTPLNGVSAFQLQHHCSQTPAIWQGKSIMTTINNNRPRLQQQTSLFLFFDDGNNRIHQERSHCTGTPNPRSRIRNSICTTNTYYPLFSSSSNDNESDDENVEDPKNDSNDEKQRFPSVRRIGGRNRKPKILKSESSIDEPKESRFQFPSAGSLVVVLLIFTLFKNLLFANSSSDYYYYSYSSSSVVETRVNSEGKQETSRKESSDLKTNIPGLRQEDVLSTRPNIFYFDE